MNENPVPEIRIQAVNQANVAPERDYILYWMTAFRRLNWNFALQRAVDWSRELGKPLVILEALRVGYPWASDRLHGFILEGMAENVRMASGIGVTYYPYVERAPGEGKGLLNALAARAAVVITDDYPCFFLPRMIESAATRLPVRLERIDSNGLLPLRAADQVFPSAYSFRRFLQKNLRPHLTTIPQANPLAEAHLESPPGIDDEIRKRWPAATPAWLDRASSSLNEFPIDHSVTRVQTRGGEEAARETLKRFIRDRLRHYGDARNQPEEDVTSGLSPYLHFGHISVHQVFTDIMSEHRWSVDQLPVTGKGSRSGWWGVSSPVESFLDELITWRELGYNMCWQRQDYADYESLPSWAQETLHKHAEDERAHTYTIQEFEGGCTHDPLWNAAQMQLVREGRIHNYLRMLWGKKILEWSPTPRDALTAMIELNNKYALDGRDPNSYSGIFWCLGRYDRPWGPERPVFGTIRYMSSENTARKVRVKEYLKRYAP